MHHDLFMQLLKLTALLVTPVIPHFADHIWTTVLQSPTSIQVALFPPVQPADKEVLATTAYVRAVVKDVRDRSIALDKQKAKAKGAKFVGFPPADRTKPMKARLYVATEWPEWQRTIDAAVQEAYTEEKGVDDVKVREALTKAGLMKNKKTMPHVVSIKVRP